MANLLEVLGVSPDDMGSVPQDIKDASTLLEGMQDIYEEMPISKRKEEFSNVISEGVKQLLIRLGALTRLGNQSTQNIQQQLPTNQDYRGSLFVLTSKIDNYKSPFYTLYAVNSDFTFPNGARTLNSIYYKKNDSTQYFNTDTIEELEDDFATNVITMLPFKMGDVFEFNIDTIPNQPNGKGYISINGYDSNGLIVSYWSVWEDINNSEPLIIIDNESVSIFEKFLNSDKNIIQNTTENINKGKYVKVENVAIPTKKKATSSTPTPPPTSTPQPPKSTPTPPTPPPTKPTTPKTSTPPPTAPSDDEPKQMTKSEIKDAIKGLNILAKLGDKDAKASIKGLKVLLKYA